MSGVIALVFPGQGSQSIGMGYELSKAYDVARQTYDEADSLLNFRLSNLAWQGPEEELNSTINTQPALLTHSVAALRVLNHLRPDLTFGFTAGHSVGELSALVAAGSLHFPSALQLVRKRGELMKSAGEKHPGSMAAVLGLDISTVEDVCRKASAPDEPVEVANDNCPGQVVISGALPAVERAVNLAHQAGARRARTLAVSIPAHSPLMAGIQAEFIQALNKYLFNDPGFPVVSNVTAVSLENADQIRTDLLSQLTSRVRWTETIQYMISQGVTQFLELGSGNVLTGLSKRIDDQVPCFALGTPSDFDKVLPNL